MKQDDMFGDEKPVKVTRNKKQTDKRLADFHKRNTKALTPYVLVMTFDEFADPHITDEHQVDNFNETEMRIGRMCEWWGMKRTFANTGLVAYGNGKYLYRLVYAS